MKFYINEGWDYNDDYWDDDFPNLYDELDKLEKSYDDPEQSKWITIVKGRIWFEDNYLFPNLKALLLDYSNNLIDKKKFYREIRKFTALKKYEE